jgi:uncharacterized phage protein (TIGR01671 family)
MKREVKFRAWDKRVKKMRSWSYLINNRLLAPLLVNGCNGEMVAMQSTEFSDRNGVEIWDGDVVECVRMIDQTLDYFGGDNNPIKYIVKFEQGCWHIGNTPLHWVYEEFLVIGNIYENPNLLEDKE